MDLKRIIREIPDFPVKGISFKDITTLLKDKDCFHYTVENIVNNFCDLGITKVIGIEARGFILGGAIANELHAGFIPVRKSGKLPGNKIVEEYDLEYGTDKVEMHSDALNERDIVLIHDDLLATGGTAEASCRLIEKSGGLLSGCLFVVELPDLNGRKRLRDRAVASIVQFEGE